MNKNKKKTIIKAEILTWKLVIIKYTVKWDKTFESRNNSEGQRINPAIENVEALNPHLTE